MPSPDYLEYHLSLTKELHAIRDRIKDLVGHRLTSGEHRESALRTMLRRHLPPSLVVGRGFVVTKTKASEQIDILVVDGERPCLYRDGDLMIVTPDVVRAIIEVKTRSALRSQDDGWPEITDYMVKLAEKGALCERVLRESHEHAKTWTAMFVYDGAREPSSRLLESMRVARQETGHCVNCISFGKRSFVRYWSRSELESGAINGNNERPVWHAYEFQDDVSPSYFVGNLLDAISHIDRTESSFAWFPLLGGKEQYRCRRLFEDNLEIADPC